MNRADLRDAAVLARTELRVRVRHAFGNRWGMLVGAVVVGLVLLVAVPLVAFPLAVGYGRALASGGVPIGRSGAVFATLAAGSAYVGALAGFGQEDVGAVGPLVRTSVPPRAVALGRVVGETARPVGIALPVGATLLAFVGLGAAGPAAPVLLALGALPACVVGLLLGRLVGDGVRAANRRFDVSAWPKAVAYLAIAGGAVVGSQLLFSAGEESGLGAVPALVPGDPVRAYASVVFAPLGATPRPLGGVVAALLLAGAPLAFLTVLRVETHLLYREREPAAEAPDSPGDSRSVPAPFRTSPAARLAWRHLLRTRRDPRTLAHLAPLALGSFGMGATLLRSPELALALGPGTAVVGGGLLAGGAYCLNPMGDERDQLPLLLTSVPSVGALLRGRAVAGLTLGLALALGVGTPLALVGGSLATALGQSLFAPFFAVASAGTALGLGAVFPKFERSTYVNVERAHPSQLVLTGYFLGGVAVGVLGLVLTNWAVTEPSAVHLAALAGYAVLVGGIAAGGYLLALRRFGALTLDDVRGR